MGLVVMIEDNAQNARLAEKLLRHAGHEVIWADTGEDGLMQVLEHKPDVVLVDLGLPDIDGQTVIAMLRQRLHLDELKIIAFTAWPEERAWQMADAYGCNGVILKPIDTHQFVEQVSMFLSAAPTDSQPMN
jgi:CheY-like chemotaxis protein